MDKTNNHIEPESFSYYAVTQAFMNSVLKEYGNAILSVGGRVEHIVSHLPLYSKVIHVTMIPIEKIGELKELQGYLNFEIKEINKDFFEIEKEALAGVDVETCISHATLHCMNDARYGNDESKSIRGYLFAKKLVELCPKIKHVVISAAVSNVDKAVTTYSRSLDNGLLIQSFLDQNFELKRCLYDKGVLHANNYGVNERFSEEFPSSFCDDHVYVLGNYYFERRNLRS